MISKKRFNSARFFDAFQSHEDELAALLSRHSVPVPTPLTTTAVCQAVCDSPHADDGLTCLLHQLNDLATLKGRDIILGTAASFAIPGEHPGTDMTHPRAALWLWNTNQEAFERAMDRLAASGVQGGQIALFPGRSARTIDDDAAAVARFERQLNANIASWNGAERFTIRHYRDGTMLVMLVFCERGAEVNWEMDPGSPTVKIRIGRPVVQDVLFYDESTGELEIEASRAKQREILRNSFAEGVMGDDSFFPMEEQTRVLNLQRLIDLDFHLPVRSGHQAQITSVTFREMISMKPFTVTLSANRQDVIGILRAKQAAGLIERASLRNVRIELTLGSGRLDRKSIELSGDNRIKFNRASHADEVYRYLRHWTLMGNRGLEEQSAA